jgi:hypothetical protein
MNSLPKVKAFPGVQKIAPEHIEKRAMEDELRADAAEQRAAMRMARTKPTTPAGAAAMIAYTRRDIHGRRSRLANGRTQDGRRRTCQNDPAKNNSASLMTALERNPHLLSRLEASRAHICLAAVARFLMTNSIRPWAALRRNVAFWVPLVFCGVCLECG